MDWQVSRHSSVLWGFIQELQQDPKCSLFFDLTIYCSDGELPWNRLCLALSIPSCAAILNYDVPETEVAVSLADITMAELQAQLENCLPIKATIHPSLVPGGGKVSYNLVPAKPPMQNGDIGSDSDACAGDQLDPSDEENNAGTLPKKKKGKLKKKSLKLKKKVKKPIQTESDDGDTDFHAGDVQDPSGEEESDGSNDDTEFDNMARGNSQKSKSKYSKYEKPAEFDSDEWEDFCGGGGGVSPGDLSIGESDEEEESSLDEDSESQSKRKRRKASESGSESEDESPKRKRGPKRNGRVKRSKMVESSDEETGSDEEEQPMVTINATDIKLEPGVEPKTKRKSPRGPKSKRKKKTKKGRRVKFDEDEDDDYDMAMSLAISGSEDSEKEYDYGKIARSAKLSMDCRADISKYGLTEDQLDDRMVIVRKTKRSVRRGRPVKKEKEVPEPMEVKMEIVEEERIPVDITTGGVEEEAVAPLITKYQVGETVIKQCNTCLWSTDRKDKITIREHLYKHYPDVCGFACPVCRKPVKRKRELILHMERTHTPECLKLFGVEYMKQYEVGFDTSSEEQVNLRSEEYIASDCGNCKETFYSAERVKFHVEIGLCVFREEKLKVPKPKILYRGEFFDEERKKLDRVDMLDSSSSSEDERKSKKKRKNNSSEDEDFHPGEFFDYQPGILSVEQLPIHANMEGLISSLKGSPPYECVVPSCKRKVYPNRTAIKRHYVSHDPEMYSTLTCPVCKDFNKPEDQPGPMIKHIMKEHGKPEGWARENVIVDVSERLQQFRDATGVFGGRRGGFGISRVRRANYGRERRKGINTKCKKCSISIDDPQIKASFEKGGEHSDQGPQWKCGVPDCTEVFRLAYELKRHYWKHDKTLFNKLLECDSCSYSTHLHRLMQNHLEEEHPDQLFLAGEGDFNYTTVEGKRWQEFNTAANALIEANPNHHMGKEWQSQHEKEIFQTISATCNLCAEVFNTQNAFEDHEKVHKPEMIKFTCEQCDEGFIVESVYKNHIKSHSVLYTSLRSGPIRCNGCSQHFQRVMEVKKHMSTHHMNLLENCHFCEQCTDWFTFKHSLRNHMFTHADKVFRCPVCPQKQFLTQEEADEHIARKRCRAKENNHICTDCGRRFGSPKLLDIHINKVHHSVLQYQCNVCHQLFENTHLMEKHIRKSHKIETGSVLEYYTFHSLEAAKLLDVEKLNMHKPKGRRGVRTDEKYPCPFGCGGTFKRSGLTRHKKVCNRSSEDYKIEVSNAEDVDRKVSEIMEPSTDPLTGKMLWKCTQCNYTNKLRFTVKEHCEIHIPGLSHQCPHCPKTCPTRNALRVHVIRNHDQKKKEEEEMELDMEPLPIEQTGAKKITSEQQQNEISEARAWLDELAGKQLQNNLLEIENRLDADIATNGNGQDHPMSLSIKPPPKKMTLMPKTQKEEYVIQYNKPKHNSNNVTIIHHHPPQKREPHNHVEQKHHPSYHQPKPQPSPQQHKQAPVLDQDQMAKLQASYDMQHMAKPKQQMAKPKPPREPPRQQEQQPVPPNAHMGQINQGILNHPMLNHPLMNPMSPMMNRNYFDDNVSQHSEDNNITFTDDSRQQQDLNRQPPLPPITRDNSQNAQNPYGLPGYNFPIWPFYQR